MGVHIAHIPNVISYQRTFIFLWRRNYKEMSQVYRRSNAVKVEPITTYNSTELLLILEHEQHEYVRTNQEDDQNR